MSNIIRGTKQQIKLDINPYPMKYKFPQFQLAYMWKRSVIHDMFSISLPHAEKSAFEEKFKYIIVTSHLVNPSFSIHHKTTDHETQIIAAKQDQILPWTYGLTALFAIERYYFLKKIPVVSVLCGGAVGIFYSVRQKHRRSIRQLYQTALSLVQSLIEDSERLDSLLYQMLVLIKEDELMNQGYRLEMPSHWTQTDNTKLHDKITRFLRRLFMLFEEAVITLNQVTDHKQLNTLYDMYNIRSIASLSATSPVMGHTNENDLDSLTHLAQLMHAKRRECMITLLSLNMMMDFSFISPHQIQDWKVVNEALATLIKGTNQLYNECEYVLHREQGCFNSDSWRTHLNSLEQEMNNLTFQIQNYKENTNPENDSNWVAEYWSIKEMLEHMMDTFKSAEQIAYSDSRNSESSSEVLSPKDVERMFAWSTGSSKEYIRRE